jgi:hypothetical protein
MAEEENKSGPWDGMTTKERNRRVNYFIMRYMWQVIRGRNPDDTIYLAFDTSRERYTRIINTGTVRYGVGELDGLQQLTGLRREIFTGEARFECPYQVQVGKAEKSSLTENQWRAMFNWRDATKRKGRGAADNKQSEICKALSEVARTDISNNDFYRLCYFIKNNRAAPIRALSDQVRGVETVIRGLSFEMLDECDLSQLNALMKLMKSKTNLINGIIIYKKAKAGS